MIEQLIEIDQNAFRIINGVWINPLFDALLPWLRNKYIWLPLYMFILSFLVINFRTKGFIYFLGLLLVVGLCDQGSSGLLKPIVGRERPCNDVAFSEYARTLIDCGSGKSFPSSHATNHFGIAAFLSMLFARIWRPVTVIAFVWAFVVSYAQIYVGVHYPLDIIGGALMGTLFGLLVCWLIMRIMARRGVEEVP